MIKFNFPNDDLFAVLEASSSKSAQKVFEVLADTPLPPLEQGETYVIKIFIRS